MSLVLAMRHSYNNLKARDQASVHGILNYILMFSYGKAFAHGAMVVRSITHGGPRNIIRSCHCFTTAEVCKSYISANWKEQPMKWQPRVPVSLSEWSFTIRPTSYTVNKMCLMCH